MTDPGKECPKCHLANPPSALWCDCGYRFDSTPPDAKRDATASQGGVTSDRKVRVAWIAAFLWGALTILIAAVLPLGGEPTAAGIEQAFGFWLSGLILLVIALAVKRGSRIAAWALVGYAILDTVVRLLTSQSGLLLPIVLLALALPAALQLQRLGSAATERSAWTRLLYEVAFIQAALTGLVVVWSLGVSPSALQEFTGYRVNFWYLLDVAILVGLGFAAFKRQVWAGYALVLYQIGNTYTSFNRDSELVELVGAVVLVALYGVGAYYLRREQGTLTWLGRGAVTAATILLLLNVAVLTINRPTPVQRAVRRNEVRLAAVPGFSERINANPAGARALGQMLALKGARRLTDAQLLERAKLLATILSLLDERSCAETFRGRQANMIPTLNKLDVRSLQAWYDLSVTAMIAEHLDQPPVPPNPSEDEIEDMLAKLKARFTPDERSRFEKVGDGPEQASDADACWALRTMVNAVPVLDPGSQRTLARVLVME